MRDQAAATGQSHQCVLDVGGKNTESSSCSSKPFNAVGTLNSEIPALSVSTKRIGNLYRGADKSLAQPGRKQATATKL